MARRSALLDSADRKAQIDVDDEVLQPGAGRGGDMTAREHFGDQERLGGAHEGARHGSRIERVVGAPEQREAEILPERLQRRAQRRDRDVEFAGGAREASGPAGRHEIGKGAQLDHRTSGRVGSIAARPGDVIPPFVFPYALVYKIGRWTRLRRPI